jgi:FMN phosphatase YigB (HAD superfamily)
MSKKPTAIIFDLDGVLVNSSERFQRIDLEAFRNRDKEKFVASLRHYLSDCEGDVLIESGANLLWSLCAYYKPKKVFFITARGIEGYEPTLQWIKEHNLFGPDEYENELIMKPEDLDNFEFENMDDAAWKGKETAKLMKKYDILLAVDDSEANCSSFHSRGIPTLKFMAPGIGKLII